MCPAYPSQPACLVSVPTHLCISYAQIFPQDFLLKLPENGRPNSTACDIFRTSELPFIPFIPLSHVLPTAPVSLALLTLPCSLFLSHRAASEFLNVTALPRFQIFRSDCVRTWHKHTQLKGNAVKHFLLEKLIFAQLVEFLAFYGVLRLTAVFATVGQVRGLSYHFVTRYCSQRGSVSVTKRNHKRWDFICRAFDTAATGGL